MSIYPDKKDGILTGRFRVELEKKGHPRYRKRWSTLLEARKDEKAVLALWARGEHIDATVRTPGSPEVHSFQTIIPLAKGKLWDGISSENDCWAHVNAIAAILGPTTRLDAVDTHSVDKVITSLQGKGLADGTINRYLSHMRTFLVWAKKRDYRTIPIKDVIEFDWRKESVGRIRWITPDEEKALLDFLPDNVGWLVKIAIETGCRRDELLTVEKGQINGNRLHLWETKTDTPRTVPMTEATTALLTKLVKYGRMPTQRNLRSWWERARKHMGLEGDDAFVFHVTRHTCATRLVDAGINVFVIKEWMGHKRIETTLRYAHVKPQNLEDALVRVGEYASGSTDKPPFSAAFAPPLPSPTAGVTNHLSQAA